MQCVGLLTSPCVEGMHEIQEGAACRIFDENPLRAFSATQSSRVVLVKYKGICVDSYCSDVALLFHVKKMTMGAFIK